MDVFINTVGAVVVVVLVTCWYQVACSHFRF